MASVTLAALRTRVLQLADMEGSAFIGEDELRGLINDGLHLLYDKLVAVRQDYFRTEVEVTLTGSSHSLPSDFFQLLAVDVSGSDGQWHALQPYVWSERNALRNLVGASPEDVRYNLNGARALSFLPGFGAASVQAVVTYIPTRPLLVGESDAVDFPNGWEAWAVAHAAIACKAKAERDDSGPQKMLAFQEARIREVASKREPTQAGRVQDVTTGDDYL